MVKPTIRDVAKLSGVSTATVSYAFGSSHRRRRMRHETYLKIKAAAEKLGYVPNAAAAALARGHSDIVLIALHPPSLQRLAAQSTEEMIDAFTARGYQPLIYPSRSERDVVGVAQSIRPAGVMYLMRLAGRTRAELHGTGARFVFGLTSGPPRRGPWEAEVGSLQVDHIHARGYDRVVYLLPETTSPLHTVGMQRLAGARTRNEQLGWQEPEAVEAPVDVTEIAKRLEPLLHADARTAICGFDDSMALATLEATKLLGYSIPEQVGIVGAGNLSESKLVRPSLTTISFFHTDEAPQLTEWIGSKIGEFNTDFDSYEASFGASVQARAST